MNTNRTKATVIGGALAGGVALALLSPAAPALADDSSGVLASISVQSHATLVLRGAAIDVPIEVQCNIQYATVELRVTERVGSQIASGNTYEHVACTGDPQRVVVRVAATGDRAFARGSAVATANLYICDGYGCVTETANATIKITK
jgi:hypothetical protein